MQLLKVAAVEDVNGQHCPGEPTSARRPINISSVRAASLRASGLRAASSRRATDGQKENKGAETEITTTVNHQRCSSSTALMASSKNLSYADSQEPSEESQLNAIAVVDKLVELNVSLMWQKPQSSTVAEQSCVKGSQSIKGLQSLARNADLKIQQDKMGIYDWIDSQPDEDGDLKQESLLLKAQQKQLEDCKPTKSKKIQRPGMICDLAGAIDTSNTLIAAEEASLRKRRNTESSLCQFVLAGAVEGNYAKEGSTHIEHPPFKSIEELGAKGTTHFEHPPFKSIEELGARSLVTAELQDAGVSYEAEGEAEVMGIGVNTQIALEAIDMMRCGILMDNGSSPCVEKEMCSSFSISNDTQTALDAIDIIRHGIETDMVLPKGERREKNERGSKCQNISGEAQKYTSEEDRQAKINLHPLPTITPGRNGELFSRSPARCKPGGKKGSSRGTSKTSTKSLKATLFKPAGPVSESNKRFLLDFSSAMVPRRKRSRLCAPRGSLNENFEAFGWQQFDLHLHKPHQKAEKQTLADKAANVESQKSMLSPKVEGNNKERAVLTESTNGAFLTRTKKGTLTKSDCYTLLEQSRKRRKCETRCMFVLFSHSLSEDTIKEQKKMLRKLGGQVASSAAKATHFVADSFARSRNMLEIMAAGKAVVTTMWLEGCSQAQYFVDEKSYILEDVQKEKEWSFCMHSSLGASRRKPLLKGMRVAVSPNTFPDFEAMKAIIECAGGQVLQKLSSSSQSKADEIASVSFVIAGDEDYDFCVEFLRKGCKVYSTELILHGVVIQNLDFSRNRLFEDRLQ